MKDRMLEKFAPVLGLLAVIWVVALINLVTGSALVQFGIVPRTLSGLIGVPMAPFLHFGLVHAFSNSLPLLILGGLLLVSNHSRFWHVTITAIIGGGLLTWLLARGAPHIHAGASGLLFAYFGYLITRGIVERSARALAVTGVVVLLYGGMIWGVLPSRPFVSFESHLFGFIVGIAIAWFGKRDSDDTAEDEDALAD
ncbi:MAG: rhomboid family intramembrane serine protease [Alphaproteobacteria bacterium]